MSIKQRWPRAEALFAAREICRRLKPVTERLVVAGSLRRGSQSVGDVEILFVPAFKQEPADLFHDHPVNLAEREIASLLAEGILQKRLNKLGNPTWGDLNKLAVHRSGIPVDLFATTDEAWCNYLVCRTGPAELNMQIAEEALKRGMHWKPYGCGFQHSDGSILRCGSEEEVFAAVGLPFQPPCNR